MREERPTGLRVRAAQPATDGQLAEPTVVIGRHQVCRRPAVVGQKPLGGLRIVHRSLQQGRQKGADRIRAARNSSRIFGVHVGWPSSQLSMWKYWSVLPARGPASAINFAPVSAKWASMASALIVSISSPAGPEPRT